jgi:hypothetical protein
VFGLKQLAQEIKHMAIALDNLNAAIQANTNAINAAVAAGIGGATGVPEADVQKAADTIAASTAILVAATPAPPPPPTP